MNVKRILILITLVSLFASCVPSRKFQNEKKRRLNCEEEKQLVEVKNKQLMENNNELSQQNAQLLKFNTQLQKDTAVMGKSYRRLVSQYDKVNDLNDELILKMKEKNALSDREASKLLSELQLLQEDLQKREDDLKLAQLKLSEDQAKLKSMSNELDENKSQLNAKSKRVEELEQLIAAKDSALTTFKNKLSNALLGFEGDGLTIEQRNGKVYVSLEEQLLFKSGKWEVDPKGQSALKKLGTVLSDNPDINIMIEGHTDNVPYNGSGMIKDNWDLSTKRSTAIVRILLKDDNLDPKRIIAAGRGEFLPIDPADTKEARSKNRRTEIILTPNWDEIFNVLN